ncbi:hypothetical protein CHS0354_000125 [Potamilus streckersoni]|uniref:Uncharacterized protein n=1 Tax=Potamilus streckersoni TaxID=2493646 RepID=A0AAE0RYM4_9BIVA|nr:hypothetical protein CHS0354_000125 [Potamilus streckersoni]
MPTPTQKTSDASALLHESPYTPPPNNKQALHTNTKPPSTVVLTARGGGKVLAMPTPTQKTSEISVLLHEK